MFPLRASAPARYRAELYLRTDTYGTYGVQQRVVDRVRSLEADGQLTEAPVDRWSRIRTLDGDTRESAIRTYKEFKTWADSNRFSLEPAFRHRIVRAMGTADVYEVVDFPVITIALYEDDSLIAVFPCSDAEDHYTVDNCLDAFETNYAESWLSSTFQSVSVDRTAPRMEATAGV